MSSRSFNLNRIFQGQGCSAIFSPRCPKDSAIGVSMLVSKRFFGQPSTPLVICYFRFIIYFHENAAALLTCERNHLLCSILAVESMTLSCLRIYFCFDSFPFSQLRQLPTPSAIEGLPVVDFPSFFVDQSLQGHAVPQILREQELCVTKDLRRSWGMHPQHKRDTKARDG